MAVESVDVLQPQRYQAGECQCSSCQNACRFVPGFFLPEQIAPLAASLGITEQELFDKHLQINYWVGSKHTWILAPALRGATGKIYPYDPRNMGCHWLVDGKCAVHAHGKPAECQMLAHDSTGSLVSGDRDAIVARWRTPEARAMIERLLGRPLTEDDMPETEWLW